MQPQKYERTTDFTERDGDDTDHTAINEEFDAAALSINQVRENLALIQRDDGALKNGIVTADALDPSAFDAVRASVNQATQEAQDAAESALVSATTANNAKDAALVAKTGAETARDASLLNANNANASAASALASKNAAAASESNALSSKSAAEAAKTAAASSAETAKDWAYKTTGPVAGGEYSAKYWATQANVGTVATNIDNINAVGNNIRYVDAVANNLPNINAVNANKTNIDTVATNNASVSTVSANIAAIKTNADNITAIQNASTNAETATVQAGIAITQAGIATTQASISTTKASEAAASAKIASDKAAESTSSAATALASESAASAASTAAATSAAASEQSASNAANSAALALSTASAVAASAASIIQPSETKIVATAGQTVVNAVFSIGYEMVFINGIKMNRYVDYVPAPNADFITLTVPADDQDVVEVITSGTGMLAAKAQEEARIFYSAKEFWTDLRAVNNSAGVKVGTLAFDTTTTPPKAVLRCSITGGYVFVMRGITELLGTREIEVAYAMPGSYVDFSRSSNAVDVLYLPLPISAYTIALTGSNSLVTLKRPLATGGVEGAVVSSTSSSATTADKIVFADGQISVFDLKVAIINGTPIVLDPSVTTPKDPAALGEVIKIDGFDKDWVFADGRAISRADYPLLFSKLGTRFGAGDGATTFNVPAIDPQDKTLTPHSGVVGVYAYIKA